MAAGDEGGWNPDEEGVPPEFKWYLRKVQEENTPEKRAERKKRFEEWMRAGDLHYETMGGFVLDRACPKCGYHGKKPPRCTYVPEGMIPPATGHHDAIARRCRQCNYIWMERPADVEDAPPRRYLLPVHDLAAVVAEIYQEVYNTVTPEEFAPMTPAELADAVRKKLAAAGHAVPAP